MSELKPLEQTVFEEPGKVLMTEPVNYGTYKEAGVPIPQQIVSIDPGINWGAIGSEVFKQAQEIYSTVLRDNITGQKDSIYDLGEVAKTAVDRLYLDSQVHQLAASESGDLSGYTAFIDTIPDRYDAIKEGFTKGAKDILGEQDYQLFMGKEFDITKYSPLWRQVAMQARLSTFNLEDKAAERSYEVAKNFFELRRSVAAQNKLNNKDEQGNLTTVPNGFMTEREMNDIVPNPFKSGKIPLTNRDGVLFTTTQEDGTQRPINIGTDGKEVVDRNGVVLIEPKTKIINPAFNLDDADPQLLQQLAEMDVASMMSSDGRNLTPRFIAELNRVLTTGGSRHELVTMSTYVAQMSPDQISTYVQRNATNADQAVKFHMFYSAATSGVPVENLGLMLRDFRTNPESSKQHASWLQTFGSSYGSENTSALYIQIKHPSAKFGRHVLNQMTETLVRKGLLKSDTGSNPFEINEQFGDDETADGDINMFFRDNPAYKWLAVRAMDAVTNNPTLIGKTDDEIIAAIPTLVDQMVRLDIEGSHAVNINGKLISSAQLQELGRVGGYVHDNFPVTTRYIPEITSLVKGADENQRLTTSSVAMLRGTWHQNITPQDTTETIKTKAWAMVRRITPNADYQLFSTVYDSYGTIKTESDGTQLGSNNLSDAAVMQLAVVLNPNVLHLYEPFAKQTSDSVVLAFSKLEPQKKLELVHTAMQDIPEAIGWQWGLDLMDLEATNASNGGMPLILRGIKSYGGHNIIAALATPSQLTPSGGLLLEDSDGSPLLMAGYGLRSGVDQNNMVQRMIQQQLEDQLSDSFSDTKVIKSQNFPKTTKTTNIDQVLSRIDGSTTGLAKVWKPLQHDKPINTENDLVNWISYHPTTIGSENNPKVLQTIVLQMNETDTLFSKANIHQLWKYGQTQGYTNASQYWALMRKVADTATLNVVYDSGYNFELLKEVYPDTTTDTQKFGLSGFKKPQTDLPDFIPLGKHQGRILWSEESENFIPTVKRLTHDGYGIYQENGSQDYYAFLPSEEPPPEMFTPITTGMPQVEYFERPEKEFLQPHESITFVDVGHRLETKQKQMNEVAVFKELRETAPFSVDRLTSKRELITIRFKQVLENLGRLQESTWTAEKEVKNPYHPMGRSYRSFEMRKAIKHLPGTVMDVTVDSVSKIWNGFRNFAEKHGPTLGAYQDWWGNFMLPGEVEENKKAQEHREKALQQGKLFSGTTSQDSTGGLPAITELLGIPMNPMAMKPETITQIDSLIADAKIPPKAKHYIKANLTLALTDPRNISYGVPLEAANEKEFNFFQKHPKLPGMATERKTIVLNPFYQTDFKTLLATVKEETIRMYLVENHNDISFELTQAQHEFFSKDTPENFKYHTILARILAGTSPVAVSTKEQLRLAGSVSLGLTKKYPLI